MIRRGEARSRTEPTTVVFNERPEQGSNASKTLLEIAKRVLPGRLELFEMFESTPAIMSRGELLAYSTCRMTKHIDMAFECTKRVHVPMGFGDETRVKRAERRHALSHAESGRLSRARKRHFSWHRRSLLPCNAIALPSRWTCVVRDRRRMADTGKKACREAGKRPPPVGLDDVAIPERSASDVVVEQSKQGARYVHPAFPPSSTTRADSSWCLITCGGSAE